MPLSATNVYWPPDAWKKLMEGFDLWRNKHPRGKMSEFIREGMMSFIDGVLEAEGGETH